MTPHPIPCQREPGALFDWALPSLYAHGHARSIGGRGGRTYPSPLGTLADLATTPLSLLVPGLPRVKLKSRKSDEIFSASFQKRVGGNGRSSPSLRSNAWRNGCRGADPCQALAAEGGGRKARLYKGQASPATIATSGPMGCDSRPRASRQASRSALHHPFEIQKSQIFAQPVGRSRPYSPELSSSRARSPSVFVGSCRSLARFGWPEVCQKENLRSKPFR